MKGAADVRGPVESRPEETRTPKESMRRTSVNFFAIRNFESPLSAFLRVGVCVFHRHTAQLKTVFA